MVEPIPKTITVVPSYWISMAITVSGEPWIHVDLGQGVVIEMAADDAERFAKNIAKVAGVSRKFAPSVASSPKGGE
jgi:hypothetical protein